MTALLLSAHILLFVFSFAFTTGIGILGDKIARGGDAKTIHAYFSAARPLSMTGGIGWILTAVSGAALASAYGWDLMAPWLLASYGAFAVLILTGFLMHAPWMDKVIAASATPGPELAQLLRAPSHRMASILSALSVLALIFLMTARPGG
jgi:uncharacterized membrane protein